MWSNWKVCKPNEQKSSSSYQYYLNYVKTTVFLNQSQFATMPSEATSSMTKVPVLQQRRAVCQKSVLKTK